ncbi:MAG TPA: serine hydrolase domain-containing protein [Streptosporangiaceae bacterium]|nr:serine hydrolase domain-containing protein [Streptosporangiaceae bacterium]
MIDFADVDRLAASYQQRGGQPGLAYGIVVGGELVHEAGLGQRHVGGPPPDADTVFRIASMTKSFTASAILALRDDGVLKLDDAAEEYVPALRGWPSVTPDSARVSIRHLLTMTAGFPTDDPWGDRQQGLPLEDFDRFLSGGVRFNWAPGTRFEYSNLGYAILGRVITAVTGAAYPDYVRHRLLRPLEMMRTGYEAEEFERPGEQGTGPAGVARGYRRTPDGWSEVAFEATGAFAPMGGIFSCVRDLARWVAGFAAAFPPGKPETGSAHPARQATRREMQLPQVLTGWDKPAGFPGDAAPALSAYGFGLFVEDHPALGRIVSHSGGYPGFGSNMRWHPASGTGVIALGNSTYAGMMTLATRLLDAVLRHREPPGHGYAVALAPAGHHGTGPWPETVAAREAVSALLRSWDDTQASRLFSLNVAQDAPFDERREIIAMIRERIGDFGDDGARHPEFDTPAHCRWWLAGERGVVQAQIQLNPERPPRVQSLTLAVPPAAGSPLAGTLAAVVAWLNGSDGNDGTDRYWPDSIPVTDTVDAGLLARRLRMAAVWAGPARLGAYRAGDGVASVAVELVGEHATLTLTLLVDPASGVLRQADMFP